MKLKDITPGNYYLTKGDTYTQPVPVKALGLTQVRTYGGPWGSSSPDATMTKIKVADLFVDDDGSVVERESFTPLVPGRIQSEISAEKAVEIITARFEQRRKIKGENKAADEGGAAFLQALSAAGFAGAHQSYKGIEFSNAMIADWLRANSPAAVNEAFV